MRKAPEGWSAPIRRTSTQIFLVIGVPFELFVAIFFGGLYIGYFIHPGYAVVVAMASLWACRIATDRDPDWFQIQVEKLRSAVSRWWNHPTSRRRKKLLKGE